MSRISSILSFLLAYNAIVNAIATSNSTIKVQYSLNLSSKNFASARRIPGSLQGKLFTDKPPCGSSSNSSLPFVQIRRKSSSKKGENFLCNGLLVSPKLVLTSADCVDQITNTSKWHVMHRLANNSISSSDISWSCKHPKWKAKRVQNRLPVALITLDSTLTAKELECFAPAQMPKPLNKSGENLMILRMRDDNNNLSSSPLEQNYLKVRLVKCDVAEADDNLVKQDSKNICFKLVGSSSKLCNLQSAIVNLSNVTINDGNQWRILGMITSSSSSNLSALVDEQNCLTSINDSTIQVLNLTKLWLSGELNVLLHHCSRSR